MPGADLRLRLRLTADNKGFVGEVRVSRRELDRLTGAERKGGAEARRYGRSQREAARETRQAGRSFTEAHGRLARYVGGFAALDVVRRAVGSVVRYSNANVELNNRIRLVTESERELTQARGALFAISQDTRSEFAANATLYSRLSQATQRLGRDQGDVLKVTRLLNQQTKIGGATTAEATAGLIQFSQGLASGRLQGDELRSVLENLQGVQQGLIVGFAELRRRGQIDFDVTRENIRELASQGVLSADLLLDAILASADDTEQRWRDVAFGIGDAWTQVDNSLQDVVRRFEEEAGVFELGTERIEGVAAALDSLDADSLVRVAYYFGVLAALLAGKVAISLGLYTARTAAASAASLRFAFQLGANSQAVGRQSVALIAGARAARVYSGSVAVAARSTRVFWASLGPIALAIVGVASVVDLLASSNRDLDSGIDDLTDGFDRWGESVAVTREQLAKLSETQRELIRFDLKDEIEAAKERLEDAQRELERAEIGRAPIGRGGRLLGAFEVDDERATRAQWAVEQIEQKLADLQRRYESVAQAQREAGLSADQPERRFVDPGLSPDALDAALEAEGKRLAEVNREAARVVASLRGEVESLTLEYLAERQAIQQSTDLREGEKAALLASLAARHQTNLAILEQRRTFESVTRPVGELTEAYGRQRAAILSNTEATRAEKIEAIQLLQAKHRTAVASKAVADAEEFEAAKRRATAKAWEMLRRTGVIALKELGDSNALLAAQTDFSRAGLERLRREAAIGAAVLRDLADASEEVREKYRERLRVQYDLLDQARIKTNLIEQFAPSEVDQADRQRALNALYRDGVLSLRQYAAAQADLAFERGEGGVRAGFISEFERMRQETRSLSADLGSSLASVFGPDGVLQQGISDSVAASLLLGESFNESLGRVAKQAAAQLVSELVRAYILVPLLNKALRSGGRGEEKAAHAAVGQTAGQALAAAGLAAANAYAATAIIPFAGPAAAPAAAKAAFAAALKYGAIAVAGQTAAAGATASKFQYGGIIDRRVQFGFGGGQRGLAGEAGPEAILPLRRGPGGRLGVESTGGSRIVVIHLGGVQVMAPEGTDDPAAFGRAAAQGLVRELRPVLRELLIDEQRPGGALNRSDQVRAF